jgi:hypothetical protein
MNVKKESLWMSTVAYALEDRFYGRQWFAEEWDDFIPGEGR